MTPLMLSPAMTGNTAGTDRGGPLSIWQFAWIGSRVYAREGHLSHLIGPREGKSEISILRHRTEGGTSGRAICLIGPRDCLVSCANATWQVLLLPSLSTSSLMHLTGAATAASTSSMVPMDFSSPLAALLAPHRRSTAELRLHLSNLHPHPFTPTLRQRVSTLLPLPPSQLPLLSTLCTIRVSLGLGLQG